VPVQLSLKHRRGGMCSPPDSIPILQMLVRLTNARRVVEVGVFTGCVRTHFCHQYRMYSMPLQARRDWRRTRLPIRNLSKRRLCFADHWRFLRCVVATCTQAVHAERAIECCCRYTALGMALALPADGKLIACDITDEYPSIGTLPDGCRVWRLACCLACAAKFTNFGA